MLCILWVFAKASGFQQVAAGRSPYMEWRSSWSSRDSAFSRLYQSLIGALEQKNSKELATAKSLGSKGSSVQCLSAWQTVFIERKVMKHHGASVLWVERLIHIYHDMTTWFTSITQSRRLFNDLHVTLLMTWSLCSQHGVSRSKTEPDLFSSLNFKQFIKVGGRGSWNYIVLGDGYCLSDAASAFFSCCPFILLSSPSMVHFFPARLWRMRTRCPRSFLHSWPEEPWLSRQKDLSLEELIRIPLAFCWY